MSEEINPGTPIVPDVAETEKIAVEAPAVEPAAEAAAEPVADTPAEEQPAAVETEVPESPAVEEPAADAPVFSENATDYAGKTLAEIVALFEALLEDPDRMKKSRQAEAIKSAFYKKLSSEKVLAGLAPAEEESSEEAPAEVAEAPAADAPEKVNPFEAVELGFKSLFAKYKEQRAEYNKEQEKSRDENLVLKQAVIEDLKALVEKQEDISATFPAFRAIQTRWREIGPVPAQNFRDINDTYQFYVEKFYDMVKINHDLRDLDFKKNLEAKTGFCEQAEKLAEDENVIEAFHELQKLHEQWKEFGPVAKEYRESIWERFRAATSVINKKYQAHFEGQKEQQAENLAAKTAFCEEVEALAGKEIKTSAEWGEGSRQILEIQKKWRTIGFASKKENQKIYDRFRAACDKFFERKRDFYSLYKDEMNGNIDKKEAIIEQAEALKSSTDWKKTTEAFIDLQKQWKEIGAVPRKKSEQLWKRFRAACDEFFEAKAREAKPENDYRANLKAKKAVIDEVNAFEGAADEAAMNDFEAKWQAIGFVPFKEKEAVNKAFEDAMKAKFPDFDPRPQRASHSRAKNGPRAPRSEKDRLIQKYNQLQQDIDTQENNIGFFAASKNSAPLIQQMQERIEAAKKELAELAEKIRNASDSEEEE